MMKWTEENEGYRNCRMCIKIWQPQCHYQLLYFKSYLFPPFPHSVWLLHNLQLWTDVYIHHAHECQGHFWSFNDFSELNWTFLREEEHTSLMTACTSLNLFLIFLNPCAYAHTYPHHDTSTCHPMLPPSTFSYHCGHSLPLHQTYSTIHLSPPSDIQPGKCACWQPTF